MAEYTYEELSKKTVAQLRDLAKELDHEAVRGYSQLNKEPLLQAVCKALGVEARKKVKRTAVSDLDKGQLKGRIKELKSDRDAALSSGDHRRLKMARNQMKRLKRRLRHAA